MSPKRKVARRTHQTLAAAPVSPSTATATAIQRFNRRRRRRAVAVALFVLGPIIAFTHILEHLGTLKLMSPALEDVLIGWPTAILFLIVGGILWG